MMLTIFFAVVVMMSWRTVLRRTSAALAVPPPINRPPGYGQQYPTASSLSSPSSPSYNDVEPSWSTPTMMLPGPVTSAYNLSPGSTIFDISFASPVSCSQGTGIPDALREIVVVLEGEVEETETGRPAEFATTCFEVSPAKSVIELSQEDVLVKDKSSEEPISGEGQEDRQDKVKSSQVLHKCQPPSSSYIKKLF
ncbi:hypothetical protein C8J56DRAFT_958165 [Mycena floridula]|nr:hypothetical protein C8J56DRAFT_958165 [Mycena floridula]